MTLLKSMSTITIIIPVHNAWERTSRCLRALAETTPAEDVDVLVADCHSNDLTPTRCPAMVTEIFGQRGSYHRFNSHVSKYESILHCAQHVSSPLLFLLDNNVVVSGSWLYPLIQAFNDDAGLGAAASLHLLPGLDRVESAGTVFHVDGYTARLHCNVPAGHSFVQKTRRLTAVSDHALLIPRNLFLECRSHIHHAPPGFEDLSLYAALKTRQRRVICAPQSRVLSRSRFTDKQHPGPLPESLRAFFPPDYIQHALDDGLEVRVTQSVLVYLALPESTSRSLLDGFPSPIDVVKLAECLEDEPYWENGYELLCGYLEKHGLLEEAMVWRYWQCRMYPHLHNARLLLALARQRGDDDMIDRASDLLANLLDTRTDIDRRRTVLKQHIDYFISHDHPELSIPFVRRLEELNKNTNSAC